MNKLSIIISLFLLTSLSVTGQESTSIRFDVDHADCENNKILVNVQIVNNGSESISLGVTSLRFTHNPLAIENPVLNESFFAGEHLVKEKDGVVSYGIIQYTGENHLEPGVWTNVAQISFDVLNQEENLDLTWNRADSYPASTMQQFKALYDQPSLKIESFGNTLNESATDHCLKSISENGLSVNTYPNPASEYVNLTIDGASSEVSIHITDMLGRLVYEENIEASYSLLNHKIDLNGFSNGSYMVRVVSAEKETFEKLEVFEIMR